MKELLFVYLVPEVLVALTGAEFLKFEGVEECFWVTRVEALFDLLNALCANVFVPSDDT